MVSRKGQAGVGQAPSPAAFDFDARSLRLRHTNGSLAPTCKPGSPDRFQQWGLTDALVSADQRQGPLRSRQVAPINRSAGWRG